ncbi:unnamed protein product [Vicia faba]|uniref:Phytocyanin domain-containing protein n=1 Tax=Vicia faba TaxID=3906 RepID=A0AAV0Z279_VICFA|nr:unnamed protein product [Vicia faba]
MAKMSSGFILFVSMMFLISSLSCGYKFKVGGKDGWAVKPSAGYAQWAHSLRFQINDSLYFKYDKAYDSVLVVNEKEYYSCNTKNPIKKFEGGESTVNLDRSGSFYFISGNVESCGKGEKLAVLVLSPRHGHKNHGPAKSPWVAPVQSPAPSLKAPAPSWTAPAPGYKAPSPSAPGWTAPAPAWKAPAPGWTAPAPHSKALSPGSKAHAPVPGWKVPAPESPAPGWKAPTPSWTAPSPGSTASAPNAPSPGSTAPAPNAPSPGSTATTPSAPEWNASAPSQRNAPAPSPRSSGSSNLSVSHCVILAVALVLASFVF